MKEILLRRFERGEYVPNFDNGNEDFVVLVVQQNCRGLIYKTTVAEFYKKGDVVEAWCSGDGITQHGEVTFPHKSGTAIVRYCEKFHKYVFIGESFVGDGFDIRALRWKSDNTNRDMDEYMYDPTTPYKYERVVPERKDLYFWSIESADIPGVTKKISTHRIWQLLDKKGISLPHLPMPT